MSRRPGKRVVIVGGGFAGIYAASYLASADLPEGSAEVVLVSNRSYFTFTPLLAEVVGGTLGREDVVVPLAVLAAQRGFTFRQAWVDGVDTDRAVVESSVGPIPFDFLVLATGAAPRYFGNQEIRANSLPLTSVREALAIRERMMRSVEAASRESRAARRRELLTFCVAGAGPAGVEVAAELWHMLSSVLPRYYPLASRARVLVLQGGDGILPGWQPELARAGLAVLRERGIEVRLGAHVQGYDGTVVRWSGGDTREEAEAGTLVWTAGTAPNRVSWRLPEAAVAESGHLRTDEYLRISGFETIFAAGDATHREDPRSGRPYPAVAPIAISQGIRAAANIENAIVGRELEPYRAHHAGSIVSLGRGAALVDILGWTLEGRPAWALYRLAYLMKLVGMRNKLRVATSLALSRVFEPDVSFDWEPAGEG